MMHIKRTHGAMAFIAAALVVMVAFSPVFTEETDASNPATTINIQPGQSWSWTPTFTSGLSPTVQVSASDTSMPADNASFSTQLSYYLLKSLIF